MKSDITPSPVQPFTPLRHCPQCDGAIDNRCVRTSPVRHQGPLPRRRVEAWCDHCRLGFVAILELTTDWTVREVQILRGERCRSIRTYAETQTGITRIEHDTETRRQGDKAKNHLSPSPRPLVTPSCVPNSGGNS